MQIALATVAFAWVAHEFVHFEIVDTCLDAGGVFNYNKDSCEGVMNYVPLMERENLTLFWISVFIVGTIPALIIYLLAGFLSKGIVKGRARGP